MSMTGMGTLPLPGDRLWSGMFTIALYLQRGGLPEIDNTDVIHLRLRLSHSAAYNSEGGNLS
jgi:hypothetical protein